MQLDTSLAGILAGFGDRLGILADNWYGGCGVREGFALFRRCQTVCRLCLASCLAASAELTGPSSSWFGSLTGLILMMAAIALINRQSRFSGWRCPSGRRLDGWLFGHAALARLVTMLMTRLL
jgi:hypothetical protein